jgi:hypothetical protein
VQPNPWPFVLAVAVPFLTTAGLFGADAPPRQVRVVGPDVLQRGTRQLVYAEGTADGRTWRPLDPDHFRVRLTGPARLLDDPAAKLMNPFEVRCDDVEQGRVTVEVQTTDRSATKTFTIGRAKPAGSFEATVSPAEVSHRFAGLGGGVLFYDNQFDITGGDDLYDWCFRDIRTSILHVLIRPGYEKEADRGDWRTLDLTKFDFRSLERPFRIVKKALERNPELQIYASLYSPPPWMKTNGSTGGQGSLRDGAEYRRQLARYVFAYLQYARSRGITVHYLGFFNVPDWPHTEDGMHFADLGVLAETFHDCALALDALIAADGGWKAPVYVFPDALGAGSVTRAGAGSRDLARHARALGRVGVWGVHDYWNQAGPYWNNRFRELRAFPGVGTRPIWLTEWAQRGRHGDLASGVEYGAEMLNALRLGAEAWMVFEWCHPSGNQAGLISTDWGARPPRARYWRSKAYHVFRQIGNTTPAGARVVSMTGRWTGRSQANGKGVEYLALRAGDDVIVHLLNTEPAPVTYRVHVRTAVGKAEGLLTTPAADLAPAGPEAVTVRNGGGSCTVSGVVAGNALLSVVLRGQKPS